MKIKLVQVFAFKFDHHYSLGGHTDAPNRMPGTDYYFEPQWRQAYSRLTESCLVKITTDTGLVGWGEAQAPLVPEVPATLIARLFGPAIIGLDPREPQFIYDRLYHINHVRGHTASYTIDAMAAIDIALWDIKGKAENASLNSLMGDIINTQLPLYVSGLRKPSLPERVALAEDVVKEGYKGIKVFIGDTVENTIKECSAIREAIGADIDMAFDAICCHDFKSAYAIGMGLDQLQATWFEAPIDPEDIAGHAKLARLIKTPLAIGEPLRTLREFRPWLEQRAMSIAQPDIVRCGITGGKQIIQLVLESDVRVAPHIGVCTAIGIAATWHLSSLLADPINQEHQLNMFETSNKVLKSPLRVISGCGIVPDGPGLGIEVDEQFVTQHSSERWIITEDGIENQKNLS